MGQTNTAAILASYSTLKGLHDENKYVNSFQLLAEFIHYIISEYGLYSFTAVEMKNRLHEVFEFDIPEAVIKPAAKSLPFITKDKGGYIVDSIEMTANNDFIEIKEKAETTTADTFESICEFIANKIENHKLDRSEIMESLVFFLIDDYRKEKGNYIDLISEFIVKNEGDKELQDSITAIKEGSILYIGLNHNINEVGSIKKNLNLYLGTEILFSLVGYNGEIYKRLAEDFYEQVVKANATERKINLFYFEDVKNEMDGFFESAKAIVQGKMRAHGKVAMKAIVNNCNTPADVQVKMADFYHTLQYKYGILEDKKGDYYDPDYDQYNLENMSTLDPQSQTSWRLISHINKLRKGKIFSNNIDAEHIIVSNTKCTILASNEQSEIVKKENNIDKVSDYAVTLEKMTNILWYKLGNGFGKKQYPSNVNTVLKAKAVLSAKIAKNVAELYDDAKKQYETGQITKEQLATRIVMLNDKSKLPEELEGECIEEIMDFSSEFLSRFEEEVYSNREKVKEQERTIHQMEEQTQKEIQEKDRAIEENNSLKAELEVYRKKEERKKTRVSLLKRVALFVFNITWKAILLSVIIVLILACKKHFSNDIVDVIGFIVNVISIIIFIIKGVYKEFRRLFR